MVGVVVALAAGSSVLVTGIGAGASTTPDCGGQATLTTSGGTWQCSLDTEFTGTSLPAPWLPFTTASAGYVSGMGCFMDSPNNISVGNGYLTLTDRKEAQPFLCTRRGGLSFVTQYTAGSVTTDTQFSQAYGRVEVSAEVPSTSVPGLHSAMWMYPQNPIYGKQWPDSGEIDIAETFSFLPGIAASFLHYNYNKLTTNTASNTNVTAAWNCGITPGVFNDYVVEWNPNTITMYVNGTTCLKDYWVPSSPLHHPQPFDQPFFLILTQALGAKGKNAFSASKTPLPATMEIQYVRVWSLTP